MKQLFFYLFLIIFTASLQLKAQTKLIAHKSHSGNNKTFVSALSNKNYQDSDFGLIKQRIVDSVTYYNDTTITLMGKINYGDDLFKENINITKSKSQKIMIEEVRSYLKNHSSYEISSGIIYIGFDTLTSKSTKNNKTHVIPNK